MPESIVQFRAPEPRWHIWGSQPRIPVPGPLRSWLLDRGSLTRRVVAACSGEFRVVVRLQAWGRPQPGERRLLHLRRGTGALVREVELHCAGRPWVFARTLIPPVSLRGAGRRLARLRDRPLGAVLFADPGVQRGPVEVARLLPQHLLFRRAAASLVGHPPLLWARRTLFYMAGRPLLINEVFLPELPSS